MDGKELADGSNGAKCPAMEEDKAQGSPRRPGFQGTSREIAIEPVAIVSLLLSSMVQKIVDPAIAPASYRKMIFTVTFLTGVFQFACDLFRLGFLVYFLFHAAITGFMGGAAIVIRLQELQGLLGLGHFTSSTDVVSVTKAVWAPVHEPMAPGELLHWMFLSSVHSQHEVHTIAPVLSVALPTLMVYVTRADKHGVKIIQKVDAGINASSVKKIDLNGPHATECVKEITGWANEKRDAIHSVVLDMSNVINIDTSGVAALEETRTELVSCAIQANTLTMAIAGPGWQVIHKMKLAGLVDGIRKDWIFLTVGEAVEACTANNKGSDLEC
ncbi:hypothetical protein ACP70R_012870 [Stipagrostis hirtigluma subsp. patula]